MNGDGFIAYGRRAWFLKHPDAGGTGFICPQPTYWARLHRSLKRAWEERGDPAVPEPPPPLILGGWAWSDDRQKLECWKAQVAWAERYGFKEVFPTPAEIPPEARHEAHLLAVNPPPAPHYGSGTLGYIRRVRPPDADLDRAMAKLRDEWPSIAGNELAAHCCPAAFAGRKRRRLIVQADEAYVPSWGPSWNETYPGPRAWEFSRLREAINAALDPHAVDHVDFKLAGDWPTVRKGANAP